LSDRLIWITYRRKGALLGGLLMRASYVIFARMRAAMERLDQGVEFGEAHELDEATVARVPAKMIGCLLTPDEAQKLLRRIEGRGARSRRA
jgi:hypothetical protein